MTQKLNTQVNLEDLIAGLANVGINVRSPHQQMQEEERGGPASTAAPNTVPASDTNTPATTTAAAAAPTTTTAAAAAPTTTTTANAAATAQPTITQATANANEATRTPSIDPEVLAHVLRALGIDIGEAPITTTAEPNAGPGPSGGSVSVDTPFPSSGGGGGTAVMASAAHPVGVQTSAKGKAAVAGPSSSSTKGDGVLVAGADSSGFFCSSCNEWNLRPTSLSYYVVTVGLDVGIFTDWHVVSPLVTGVRGAVFKKYSSHEVAQAVFNEALAEGRVRRVSP